MSLLKLGLPKGSLEQATYDLFRRAGWKISPASRNYFPSIDDPEIECSLVRAQEMAKYVDMGVLDAGLTGLDWILENQADVELVADLVYSKATARQAKWVIAVRSDAGIDTIEQLAGKRISTELVESTRRYFAERHIPVEVEFSWGATEAKVAEGLVDAIVEVTETGSTIRAHGLKIIHTMLETNTKLIANKAAWADEAKRQKIENLALLLQGALNADGMVGLKMNVPEDRIAALNEVLPSLNGPTVAHLYGSDWLAVEVVVPERQVRDLIPLLRERGAEGIIEYPLNKVI